MRLPSGSTPPPSLQPKGSGHWSASPQLLFLILDARTKSTQNDFLKETERGLPCAPRPWANCCLRLEQLSGWTFLCAHPLLQPSSTSPLQTTNILRKVTNFEVLSFLPNSPEDRNSSLSHAFPEPISLHSGHCSSSCVPRQLVKTFQRCFHPAPLKS